MRRRQRRGLATLGGTQERIATGLPSYAPESGAGATGPHDISLHGRGNAYVTIGLGANPDLRARHR